MTDCNAKELCEDLSEFECIRKRNICKLRNKYEAELTSNIRLKKTYSRLKYNSIKYPTANYFKRQLPITESRINISSKRLIDILDSIKLNIEKSKDILNREDESIESKNNQIIQKDKRIQRINNQIGNLQQEFLSNEQKIISGIERNQYKRNIIIFLIILSVLLSGSIAYLLINK